MDNLDLKQFNIACEDFISGKYILANIKVKALINSINASEKLTNLVSNSLDGFDFSTAFRESVTSSGLQLPHEDKNVIAYCFNVLYNLDEGTVTFLDFLTKYFASSKMSGGEEFKLFTSTIIEPFKRAINNEYQRAYEMTATEDCQNNLYHKLSRVAEANINVIDEIKLKEIEKEELQYLLTAIMEASERNDKKLIYALMVGVDYFVKSNKRAKDIYLQLKDCFTIN
ncbi:MAG: hypothetical protein J6Q15_01315 [Clostridia bacterium]|nr:hypothetical protein [Clostridia bacterium]